MSDTVTPSSSSGLINRAKDIILKPAATWDVIATETSSVQSIYMGYVVPLALIPAVASAIGLALFGVGALFVTIRLPLMIILSQAVLGFVLSLLLLYVQGLVIDALATNFGAEKNKLNAFKLAAYSWTPAWVGGILGILPSLAWLGALAGIYGIYLLYLGLPKLMKAPQDKVTGYTAVTIIVTIVLALIAGAIVASVGRLGMPGLGSPLAQASVESKANGKVTIPGMGTMDLDKMQKASEQMAAQASAMESGKTTVKTADPQALLALLPQSYMGAARSDTSASADAMGGVTVSNVRATYMVNGNSVRIKLTDMGSMAGFGAMAQAMNVNHTETTDTGYSKVVSENGRTISETYNNQAKSGSYTILTGNRISLEVEGDGVDMATMKALAGTIDLGKAEALTK